MAANRVGTILTADFGSVHTRAVLIDVVDGEYRVVARESGLTTLGYPVDELNLGLKRLLKQMSDVTGRNFYNQIGRIIIPEDVERNGVDAFITTASAGRPIRAVLVGLMPDISITSALRAMSGTYIEASAQIHLRDGRSDEERLNAILLSRPDLLLIVGGTDKGAKTALMELLKIVRLALSITDTELRPTIIFAGNKELHEPIKAFFGDLTSLMLTDNLRPKMEEESFESITRELDNAYDQHRETHGDAFRLVSDMSSTGLLPTAQSYALVADYFAKTRKGNVIAVDMGSTSSVMVGVFNGQASTRISTTKGLGQSADTLRQEVGEDVIASWLPYYPEAGEIHNYALNKLSRPYTVPLDTRDLFMEHAFLRAGLRQMKSEARGLWNRVEQFGTLPPIKTIIAGGSALTGTGSAAYNMMLIADSLQPIGVTEIKGDPYGIIPAMGAIAKMNPTAAVQLLEGGSLEHYGTLISFEGNPRAGRSIARLKITLEDGERVDYDLKGGEILTLPLPERRSLKMQIRCSSGISVGGKSSLKLTLDGGTAGIMIDGRGRNFHAPDTVAERSRVMPVWIQKATDLPFFIEIPEEWLVKPVTETSAPVNIKVKAKEAPSTIELLAMDDEVFPAMEEEKPVTESKRSNDKKAKGKKGKDAEPAAEDDIDSLRDLLN
jgi:hypothetical protein